MTLSPNRHVMLQLTIFEIFTVKWLFVGPKFRILRALGASTPKKGKDTSGTYMYHHAKFHDNRLHCHRSICPQTKKIKTANSIFNHTTVWQIILRLLF